MKKLWTFLQNVFAPGLHIAFAAAWFLALVGSLVWLRGGALSWRFDPPLLAGVASLLITLFYLRVVDEVKDYDYDLVHNRDRLLVLGEVSHGDLLRWALGSAALVLALNAYLAWALTPWLLVIAAADLLYGAFLLKLEQWSRTVNDRMLVNLAVTYPVNMALQGYVYVFFVFAYAATPGLRDALLVLAFVLVFLHYEFARKTTWPELTEPGERMYSNALGGGGSLAVVLGCAWSAVALVLSLLRPWERVSLAPAAAALGFAVLGVAVLSGLAAKKLLANRSERKKLGGLGMVGLTVFYAALGLHALAANQLTWGAG